VVAAYDELRGRGLVTSQRGSGTRVSAGAARPRPDGRVAGGQATSIVQRLVAGPGDVISLAYAIEAGVPELADALRELVDEELPALLTDVGYHPRGLPALREAIAVHLSGHGVPTTAGQVLVTTGATQAVALVAQLYLRRGTTVLVESPGWPGCLDAFRAAGARLVGVPLDDEGIALEPLGTALTSENPSLVYVMPTYHNPTGTLMSAPRRRRVAELAARADVPVVEDNAYAAAATDVTLLAGYAPRDAEVLSIGSLAKPVWGGLRIGWVRAPGDVIERLARHKALADLGSPVLDQALAARLLPRLGPLTATRQATLRQRLHRLETSLRAELPDWRWRTPDGGSALWIDLGTVNAQVYAQVALRHGIEVVPGAAMDASGAHDGFIRLPYTFPEPVLDELVVRLRRAWADLHRHGPATPTTHPIV
ncbi:MAG: PLP-dependent aminotransferase family protein, partial [Micromonosporaceae bacterium]